MPNLHELQAAVAAALEGDGDETLHTLIRPNGLEPSRRLDVYRNNTRLTRLEALGGIYPAVQRLLGEKFFAQMAELFGAVYPSRSGDLRRYGCELAQFLAEFPPTGSLAYLPDVARLEWARHEAFHAPFSAALDERALALVLRPQCGALRLALRPGVALLRSDYPAARIWEFALGEHGADAPRLDLKGAKAEHALVLRPELEVLVIELEPAEWRWLHALEEGVALDTAGELARSMQPEADPDRYLHEHLRLGSFASCVAESAR